MKIGILTQPLHNNYGGLLQAWALQRTLSQLGHEPWIIRREYARMCEYNFLKRIVIKLKTRLKGILQGVLSPLYPTESQMAIIRQHTTRFVAYRYSHLTPVLHTDKALEAYAATNQFDGYVVGSDQVWRPQYSPAIGNYFLDFLNPNSKVRRIAYAASFGVDDWEFRKADTKIAQKLLPLFDLVTVREKSGVDLCARYLGVEAHHVADPTMLLDTDDYLELVNSSVASLYDSTGELFCYVLDDSEDMQNAIRTCASNLNYVPFRCNAMRRVRTQRDLEHIEECVFPPVEQWIKSFIDAKMVVTDSFHGTVFSIIFNKPFWVVANIDRGLARFSSLLSMFGLEHRIVSDPYNTDWREPIDWDKVNTKRTEFANYSRNLLAKSLK